MSFQHTLYLKKDTKAVEGQPDELDGTLYHWCAGVRDFASSVRAHGTVVDEYTVEFTPSQALKFMADLMNEFYEQRTAMYASYNEFVFHVLESENMKVDEKCLESYAIMREMYNKMEEASHWYSEQFSHETYKMNKIINGFIHLCKRMAPDDILVWSFSY
jgi:hypothetical protein